MCTLDFILLALFVPFMVQGVRKGFFKQLIAILAIIIGGYAAFRFSGSIVDWLTPYLEKVSPRVLKPVCFFLIFVLTAGLLNFFGQLVTRLLKAVDLNWFNRFLGLFFGVVQGALLIILLIALFDFLNGMFSFVDQDTVQLSKVYVMMKDLSAKVFPFIKELINV